MHLYILFAQSVQLNTHVLNESLFCIPRWVHAPLWAKSFSLQLTVHLLCRDVDSVPIFSMPQILKSVL